MQQETFRDSVLPRAPFAIVTVAGLLGTFFPGGTIVPVDLAWCAGLLTVRLIVITVPWPIRSSLVQLADSLSCVAFVAMLVQAQGGASRSGSYSMALMAVLWIALYGGRIEGAVTVVASSVVLVWLSVIDQQPFPAIARKGIIWFLIAAGITFAAHQLRERFATVIGQRERTIGQTEALANAVAELAVLRDPDAVLAVGTRVAAVLMGEENPDARRATYFVIEGEMVRIASQYDGSGRQMTAAWPLSSHPPMRQVAETLKPVAAALDQETVTGEALRLATVMGVTHGAWVGGDEFVILLAGASADSGRQVADRILAAVESPDQARSIRVSLGIASGGNGTPFEVVVDRADGAMYTAKRAGGMRWSEWSVSGPFEQRQPVLVWPS